VRCGFEAERELMLGSGIMSSVELGFELFSLNQ
jgi:hypothetical protein